MKLICTFALQILYETLLLPNLFFTFNFILTKMIQRFDKYQGAGNDFIIIDNRNKQFNPDDVELVNRLCDRRFGIGGDGLILVDSNDKYDYEMFYFNSDGKLGSMCGNGGRCVAHFTSRHQIAGNIQHFWATDGEHRATVSGNTVSLQMTDIANYSTIYDNYFINTGSPHYMVFVDNAMEIDVFEEGKRLRWDKAFAPGGTNVNFVEVQPNRLFVRTFERGVEDETFACGTGVTASALAAFLNGHFDTPDIDIKTRGGDLNVKFNINGSSFDNVWLTGPATFVFEGEIEI